jgi:hypothetical protein
MGDVFCFVCLNLVLACMQLPNLILHITNQPPKQNTRQSAVLDVRGVGKKRITLNTYAVQEKAAALDTLVSTCLRVVGLIVCVAVCDYVCV